MDLIIRNARISDEQPLADVGIEGGVIVAMAPGLPGQGVREIVAGGRVLLPGLVESHLHLEKALIMERGPNRSGTLAEAIRVTAALKPTFTREDIHTRARAVLKRLIAAGVTHMRAHSEFDPGQGFTGFDVTMGLKDEFRGALDIQVCAFPQEGIFKMPGTEAMLREAMRRGADVVGGIPYNDADPYRHIDLIFAIAQEFDKDLDIHQDFRDDADGMTIDYVARKTMETGYEGRVSAGHLTALGAVPPPRRDELIRMIADAGISVMCLPGTDLHLGGRNDAYNVRRTLTPVRALRDGGVNVCLATNNIRNAFTPYNNGDPVQIAHLAVAAAHLGGADDQPTVLPMITANAAKALRLDGYGLRVGSRADLTLVDSMAVTDVIIDQPDRLYTIKNGRIVMESRRETRFELF